MELDTSLLNTQQYKVHIKDKGEQSRERICINWKGSLKVVLDYNRRLYFFYLELDFALNHKTNEPVKMSD